MADSTQDCSRCGTSIEKPVELNANYVTNTDLAEPTEVEVIYAMVHTEETMQRLDELDEILEDRDRDAINAESAHPDAEDYIEIPKGTTIVESDKGSIETAEMEKIEFSIPTEKFDHVEVDDPNIVQERDDVALTYSQIEERPVQKTGVVCRPCTQDDDQIIWGPDK